MVTKPGLAENAGARFCGGSALENCKRRWEQSKKYGKLRGLWEDEPYTSPITVGRTGCVSRAKHGRGLARAKKGFWHVHPVCRVQCCSQLSNL
jgi:hypothetical protein